MDFAEYLQFRNYKKKSIRANLNKMANLSSFNRRGIEKMIIDKLQNCSAATANRYLNIFRLYGKYLIYDGQQTEKQLEWLKSFKRYKEIPKQRVIFSAWEFEQFVNYKDRYTMYFNLLAFTGARPMEIATLKKADIDSANNVLFIQESKTGIGRTVPIPEDLQNDLYEFLRSHDSDWCFPIKHHNEKHITLESLRKAFYLRRNKLGLNRQLTPYCLRHSYITRMLAAGEPLLVVQQIVGHKHANTTQRYFHNNLEMMRETMKKDPAKWLKLKPVEKLKVVNDYICKLGLDTSKEFEFERKSSGLSLSII